MRISLFPRIASTPSTAQVMVAVFDHAGPRSPALTWSMNGRPLPAPPRAIVELAPARDPQDVGTGRCTHTGLYELSGLLPGQSHSITARLPNGTPADALVRALPAELPTREQGGFDVLLSSCFYAPEANPAMLGRVLSDLRSELGRQRAGKRSPDCALFMGDQVYLDMPLWEDIPESRAGVYASFEQKYRANWESVFAHFLRSAPAAHLADDHEFWNNYPYTYLLAANTRAPARRALWVDAAKHMLARFQDVRAHRRFDVAPVSFFLADGRSERDPHGRLTNTLTPETTAALEAWVAELNQSSRLRVGVFVSGQSLLSSPADRPQGETTDAEPTNFRDYDRIVRALYGANFPLILLTGDVHWGRVTVATHATRRYPMYEVIVSPLSSVRDPRLRLKNLRRRIAGKDKAFRGDSVVPERPPREFGVRRTFPSAPLPARASCELLRDDNRQEALFRGDQVGVLSFSRTGAGGVSAHVTYWMIGAPNRHHRVQLFDVVP